MALPTYFDGATADTTGLDYAWVGAAGASESIVYADTFSDLNTTDLDIDYSTERCINVVTVKVIAGTPAVETVYGPFIDAASVEQWGAHSAEFTVQGLAAPVATPDAYAAAVLAANAIPTVRLNSATFSVRDAADVILGLALVDLYDLVGVSNINAAVDSDMRVTAVEHVITAKRWEVVVGFDKPGAVALPQATPQVTD